ncbi:hypothetical protein F2P58_09335 [Vibrio fortis]|uniref:Uncharacterized protein n=1 Tax=Vibrio fortis TaxID=212667 RepID=A0A5N3R4H0_9VIBR|nr:hypothetical protein [Vibrio fortis]KAB0289273.1 hypothetical protein F2P58_09335 [Vibrio fortis]
MQQTDHLDTNWGNIGSDVNAVDAGVNELEQVYSEFKQVVQEIIFSLESQLSEIRRLLKLTAEDVDTEIADRIDDIPGYLRDKYLKLKQDFNTLSNSVSESINILFANISSWENSAEPFQRQAALLLSEYQSLTTLRANLDTEKDALETGYTDLALMRREIMFYHQRAGANLEEIERQANLLN